MASDLMRLPAVRRTLRSSAFPPVPQAALLVALLAVAALGWGRHAPAGVNAKLFAKCSLTTLLVWGLWWPLVIWTSVLLGRVWCTVCPLELVANGSERLSRALRLRPRRLPRRMLGGGAAVALYAVVQMLVAGVHVHRVPAYTAAMLLGLVLLAAATAFVFADRAFCRAVCPVAPLLAAYGRQGAVAVRPRSASTCGGCAGRPCTAAGRRDRLDARSCPTLLNPARLGRDHVGDCLLCGQCLKSCTPDNLGLFVRPPFAAAEKRQSTAPAATTMLVMLLSGFVAWELLAEWPRAEQAFLAVPERVAQALGLAGLGGFIEAVWALGVVPIAAWTAMWALARALGRAQGPLAMWRRAALPAAAVVSAAHMTKAVAKLSSWAVFVPLAIHEPHGEAALRIAAGSASAPSALLSPPTVAVFGLLLVTAGLAVATREAWLAAGEHGAERTRLVPQLGLGAVFLAILLGWRLLA
jgi:polyferredoxin